MAPKPKPKPEPKPEPKPPRPEPKQEPAPKPKPKPAPKPEPKPKPKPEPERVKVAKNVAPVKAAKVAAAEELPDELLSWGRLVQRKVGRIWVAPAGVRLDAGETVAEVAFRVDRQGNLIEYPVVVKQALDPALGESGVRAILLSAPFPPLPENYNAKEQRVVYAFSLLR